MAEKKSIIWNLQPIHLGFSYYLRTSPDGTDITTRGIVRFRLPLKKLHNNNQTVEGFHIIIVDSHGNHIAGYTMKLIASVEKFKREKELMEVQMDFDDVLQLGRSYLAMVHLLPIGDQIVPTYPVTLLPDVEDRSHCSSMTRLSAKWAAHMNITINDGNGDVAVLWQPAPKFLCIQTYEVTVRYRNGRIINSTEVVILLDVFNTYVSFKGLPRNESLIIDTGMAANEYVKAEDVTKAAQPSNATSALFVIFFIIGLASLVVFLGLVIKRYNKELKNNLVIRNAGNIFFPGKNNKKFKCFLVCPMAYGDEEIYMKRICLGLKNSKNDVVCEKFDECSAEAELNMFQWIYKQTTVADKVHVLLSPKVKSEIRREVEYILPRDEQIFENAFNMKIPAELPPVEKPSSRIQKCEDISIICEEQFDTTQKTVTMDSGVSSMSSNSSYTQEPTDVFISTSDFPLKEMKIETHPLLHHEIEI
ncbi:unnamed protein product [Caenorhabditis bovis]|uniref:ILCR1 Ig-like domain-containing protein n=1 Tax=Caenorhabditis bovis TaxID=2654633 RepID=A0A8S1EAM5_9PELO|nr:unnamed protein product [Caenorhabditis bovis]